MTTCCIAPAPIATAPLWQRALEVLSTGLAAWPGRGTPTSAARNAIDERDYEALAGLSAATLRDIGAPEWLRERAEMSRHLSNRPLHW